MKTPKIRVKNGNFIAFVVINITNRTFAATKIDTLNNMPTLFVAFTKKDAEIYRKYELTINKNHKVIIKQVKFEIFNKLINKMAKKKKTKKKVKK